MRAVFVAVVVAGLASALVACGSEEDAGDSVAGNAAVDGTDVGSDYRVVLGNAITDTLRGAAAFGVVVEPESGNARFVIRLASSFDFAGGVVIARRDTTMPAAGTYTLGAASDSLAGTPADEFLLFYREGMLRDMRAVSGSLTLSAVTDSLITGSFDVNLRGRTAGLDRTRAAAEVHAVGRFRARAGLEGFVIGL